MPMSRDEHEALLNELNDPELSHTRRAEVLSDLRGDYNTIHEDFTNLEENNKTLKKDNEDLGIANSRLFRQAGFTEKEDPKEKQQEEKKELSETITLKDL